MRTSLMVSVLVICSLWSTGSALSSNCSWEELYHRAEELSREGHWSAAYQAARAARHECETVRPRDHGRLARSLEQLADLCAERGRLSQALAFRKRAIEAWKKVVEADHPCVIRSLVRFGDLFRMYGRYEEAEDHYRQVVELVKETRAETRPDLAGAIEGLACLYQDQGKTNKAETFFQKALTLYRSTAPENSQGALIPIRNLSSSTSRPTMGDARRGRWSPPSNPGAARRSYSRCPRRSHGRRDELECFHNKLRLQECFRNSMKQAKMLRCLAEIARERDDLPRATRWFKEAAAHYTVAAGPRSIQLAGTLKRLGDVYNQWGKPSLAVPHYRRALAIYEAIDEPGNVMTGATLIGLANAYESQKNLSRYESLCHRALAICERSPGIDRRLLSKLLKRTRMWPTLSRR